VDERKRRKQQQQQAGDVASDELLGAQPTEPDAGGQPSARLRADTAKKATRPGTARRRTLTTAAADTAR